MLPWQVEMNGREFDDWDPALSRAIAALMPVKFTNRDRISGERLETTLATDISLGWSDSQP
jgi:hypothetical protein